MAHVLLVDSDPFFVRLYADALGRVGHKVLGVTKLAELEQVMDEAVDVALVELGFSYEAGVKVCEQLKSHQSQPEIIALCKAGDSALIGRAVKLGIVDLVNKPVETEHLVALCARILERRAMHSEARKLVNENMVQLGIQRVFKDGLAALQTLDDVALQERLLQITSTHTDCQGIVLYLAKRTHLELAGYFGLVDGEKLPPSMALGTFDLGKNVTPHIFPVEDPMAITEGAAPKRCAPTEAKGLMFVLAADHQPEGLLIASARLGHPFDGADLSRAQTLAEIASVALANSRRFGAERKKAVQSRHPAAFNMSFFVDYLGKELHKARRYRRSFGILQVVFDNFPGLAAELGPRGTEKLSQDLPRVLQDVLRESDVLSRAADNEYLLVLPEADLYGSRMTMSRIEQALAKDPSVLAAQKNLALGTAIAYACYPYDGSDIDSLMLSCRRRLDEARRSAYRKLHLEDTSFYDAASVLVAKNSPMRRFIDAPVEYSYTQTTPNEVNAWIRELLVSSQSLQKSHSVLYWGVPEISIDILAAIADVLEAPEPGAPNRLFLLGAKDPSIKDVPPGITTVFLDAERATKMGFLLSLSETHAYAMLGENMNVGPGEAFHTCDTHLALGLVRKLQTEFNLQRWF